MVLGTGSLCVGQILVGKRECPSNPGSERGTQWQLVDQVQQYLRTPQLQQANTLWPEAFGGSNPILRQPTPRRAPQIQTCETDSNSETDSNIPGRRCWRGASRKQTRRRWSLRRGTSFPLIQPISARCAPPVPPSSAKTTLLYAFKTPSKQLQFFSLQLL